MNTQADSIDPVEPGELGKSLDLTARFGSQGQAYAQVAQRAEL